MSKRPGWYPDPWDSSKYAGLRYWTGTHWTHDAVNRLQIEDQAVADQRSPKRSAGSAQVPKARAARSHGNSPLAAYPRRVAAFAADYLILGMVQFLALASFLTPLGKQIGQLSGELRAAQAAGGKISAASEARIQQLLDAMLANAIPVVVVSLVTFLLYHVVSVAAFAGTPGKLLMGLRVESIEGGAPSIGQAIGRAMSVMMLYITSALPVIGLVPGVMVLVSLLRPLWNVDKQALHDKHAGTVVVRRMPAVRRSVVNPSLVPA